MACSRTDLFFDTFSICANLKIWHLERGTGIRTLVFRHSHLSFKYRHINKILRLNYIWSGGIGKTECFSFSSCLHNLHIWALHMSIFLLYLNFIKNGEIKLMQLCFSLLQTPPGVQITFLPGGLLEKQSSLLINL